MVDLRVGEIQRFECLSTRHKRVVPCGAERYANYLGTRIPRVFQLVYGFEFKAGQEKTLTKNFELTAGKGGWLTDSFTAAASHKDFVYLLTYTQIIKYKWKDNTLQKVGVKSFSSYAQMEAITINERGEIFIANEGHKWLGRHKIQQFHWKK